VSFPSSIEEPTVEAREPLPAVRPNVRGGRLARVLLVTWAAGVYLLYWLGYLGLR
jgi:hypothetical protein